MQATLTVEERQLSPATTLNRDRRDHNRFSRLLDEYDFRQPQRGDILDGEILRIDEDVLYIDVGSKRDALVPHEELSRLDSTLLEGLSRGDEVPVYVTRTPVGDEQLLVSLERGLQKLDWERAEQLHADDAMVELEVIGLNKGGLVVKFGRIEGFVPNSHIPELRSAGDQRNRQAYKAQQIGSERALKIIEVDPKQRRFVLSAKSAQYEQRKQQLRTLRPGDVVTGTVVNLKKYGAFVDIGYGLTGLLHVSKFAWERVENPSEVLSIGDEMELIVDDVDVERERVSLNRKALMPDPWGQFIETTEVDDLVEGEVIALVDFGAFVSLAPGVEGLLHQSEINIAHGGSTADVLQPGDTILVRIITIEPERQRVGLSMRRVSAAEEVDWMSRKHD